MELNSFFKSVIDQDTAAVVICNLDNEIVYMNPSACHSYEKRGGAKLVGKRVLDCHNPSSVMAINKVVEWFKKNPNNNQTHTFFNEQKQKDVYMIALRDEDKNLIGYYEKHEYRGKDLEPFYNF